MFFKAAKCPHCKKMAPELEELSNDEELKELGIVFASVDVPSNRATSTRFGIRCVLDHTGEHVCVCVFCVFSYILRSVASQRCCICTRAKCSRFQGNEMLKRGSIF